MKLILEQMMTTADEKVEKVEKQEEDEVSVLW